MVRLTSLTPGIPAQTFKPTKDVLNESYYINGQGSINWNVNINKKKSIGVFENLWARLYNKQQGLCALCKQDLGYFSSDNLQIHHIKQVALHPELIHDPKNQELVHISCHKTVPIIKPTSKKFAE